MAYQHILAETRGKTGVVTLNRPKSLNALSTEMMIELGDALGAFESDDAIGAMLITGNEKSFAAGADITEMRGKTFMQAYKENFITAHWEHVSKCRKPVIAAVGGYALGGGCELAMMCDIIIAADNAKFGQPEINLGIIPGAGGTQRLIRAVGKPLAMDLCLSGRMLNADEALRAGLVARVVTADELLDTALALANEIASKSLPAVMMCKESVNRAHEMSLSDGLLFERRQFHALFASEDQKEGMRAFAEKRKAEWKHR